MFPSLCLLIPRSSLLSTPFFRPPIGLSLFPLSPCQPVARLQQCLGKADCGIPGKPRREWREEGGGEHLTQHIYSTEDILIFLTLKVKCWHFSIFSFYCQQRQQAFVSILFSLWHWTPKPTSSHLSSKSLERVTKKHFIFERCYMISCNSC